MLKSVNGIFGTIVMGATALIVPSNVSADEIALTFEAQDFTISGELLDLTDVGYIVLTDQGEFTIPYGYVTCEGSACPSAEQAPSIGS